MHSVGRILVTGATDGIGKQTALELARLGHTVLVHGRTAEKAAASVESLRGELPGGAFVPVHADLSSLRSIGALVQGLRGADEPLRAIVNNAGVFMNERVLTEDGHEMTIGVNHLAPFALTIGLLPLLGRDGESRVVNVSSIAHSRGRIPEDDMTYANAFDGYGAYAASKLINVLFTVELARRLEGAGHRNVVTHALHPGVITTKLLATGFGSTGASLQKGAETSVFVATSATIAGQTGRYYSDSREARPSEASRDAALAQRLWAYSAAQTHLDL
jgi:NAD(P)-dependent dehydrogenase (short-subunit alcohol dehydrogenase family)